MSTTVTIDLRHVARGLGIPLRQVQAVVELLDDGNTIPFITRYRKDQTGGLDEEQIRRIHDRLTKARLLRERKQAILRSIESQGKLTETLTKRILAAGTMKRLEDLYLPHKPKKRTLATLARSRGLEPLAREILQAAPTCADLNARAADFVDPDRQVPTLADALLGAGHILAEQFSERADLRQSLREVLQRTGRIISTRLVPEPGPGTPAAESRSGEKLSGEPAPSGREESGTTPSRGSEPSASPAAAAESRASAEPESESGPTPGPEAEATASSAAPPEPDALAGAEARPEPPVAGGQQASEDQAPSIPRPNEDQAPEAAQTSEDQPPAAEPDGAGTAPESAGAVEDKTGPAPGEAGTQAAEAAAAQSKSAAHEDKAAAEPSEASPQEDKAAAAQSKSAAQEGETATGRSEAAEVDGQADRPVVPAAPRRASVPGRPEAGAGPGRPPQRRLSKRELKKQKAEERKIKAFRDYFDFSDEVRKIPPHRVLALNRGERAKVLRVKVEADLQAMYNVLDEILIPTDHPHAEFLRGCARDALARLILPSLERELRRELTERAEAHAVGVFAKNLRNLLLQPPVRGRRVLAVDPGLRSGCKLAALDQFGNVLGHDVIYLVGRADRRRQAKDKALGLIRQFDLTAVAIGNGTGCRQAEDFFGRLIEEEEELKSRGVAYVIVNEAGASVYSTSRIGREEFPHYDAALRGAISIGRRLLDPLSELVKIDPPNIGVGLYQHDMKARHLRTSLDEVVESCVNYVGVDVNTASPSLLRRVSGLNQLTARRVFEHRRRHGPFRSREQLREVPGVGEATFVQAAGFLKITGATNPLDATWIHPESYPVATAVLEKLGCTPADLADREAAAALARRIAEVDAPALAAELGVGIHTLRHILAQLARPGRDPREDLPQPVFKHGILKLEDLQPGMELTGTVLNVVDFGAFVDIGIHDCGLVHVSQLADRFVRDPHDVVTVGDVIRVWVMEVDRQRRRVSLTMIAPGTERSRRPRREARRESDKPRAETPPARARADRPPKSTGSPPRHRRPPKQKPAGKPPRKRGGAKRARRPLRPITEAMIEGKEPLRTFGDLLQLYQHKRRAEAQDQPEQPPAEQPSPETPAEQHSPPTPPQQQPPAEPSTPQSTVGQSPSGEQADRRTAANDQTTPHAPGAPDAQSARTSDSPSVAAQEAQPTTEEPLPLVPESAESAQSAESTQATESPEPAGSDDHAPHSAHESAPAGPDENAQPDSNHADDPQHS